MSYDITYMWNLKKGKQCINLQNRSRLTQKTNMVANEKGLGEGYNKSM